MFCDRLNVDDPWCACGQRSAVYCDCPDEGREGREPSALLPEGSSVVGCEFSAT